MEEEKKVGLWSLDRLVLALVSSMQDMDWRSAIERDYREMLKADCLVGPAGPEISKRCVGAGRCSWKRRIRYEKFGNDGKKQSASRWSRPSSVSKEVGLGSSCSGRAGVNARFSRLLQAVQHFRKALRMLRKLDSMAHAPRDISLHTVP